MGLMVAGGKVAHSCLGPLCSSSAALPWGYLSFTALGEESGFAGLPAGFLSLLFGPFSVQMMQSNLQAQGVVLGCVLERRARSDCYFPPVETIRRGGSTFPKQAGQPHLAPRNGFLAFVLPLPVHHLWNGAESWGCPGSGQGWPWGLSDPTLPSGHLAILL